MPSRSNFVEHVLRSGTPPKVVYPIIRGVAIVVAHLCTLRPLTQESYCHQPVDIKMLSFIIFPKLAKHMAARKRADLEELPRKCSLCAVFIFNYARDASHFAKG